MAGSELLGDDWTLVKSVRNPWGEVPVTGGGESLQGRARDYMDKLIAQQDVDDPVSRRHHYVPKTYLRKWALDKKRIWALDMVRGVVREFGLADVCVEENFYRVVGPDGAAHNRVELLFGVVDTELRRVQDLFNELQDPDELEFDDLIGLGVTMAVQRMRTLQQRRLQQQLNEWLVAQNSQQFKPLHDPDNPHLAASFHTMTLFKSMWNAADVLTTRQIEVWHDPEGRFMTCDAPVLVPFRRGESPDLLAAPYIVWPISPYRVVALGNELTGDKAIIREATSSLAGLVRRSVEQGRERMIFASDDQHERLRQIRRTARRRQIRLSCAQRTPEGRRIERPGCCVKRSDGFAKEPIVALCRNGLHSPAPDMWNWA